MHFYNERVGHWIANSELSPEKKLEIIEAGNIEIPPPPTYDHVWSGSWVLPDKAVLKEKRSAEIRRQRDSLLYNIDPIISNSFRFGDLPEHKQNALLAYRKDLLDITKQKGFPDNVVWPQAPKL